MIGAFDIKEKRYIVQPVNEIAEIDDGFRANCDGNV